MSTEIKREGIILCLVGPAGAGKTTFGDELLRRNPERFSFAVSCTSRAPRTGEQEGEDYHFVSRSEFQRMIDSGELFEWEETHGNFYGMPKREIEVPLKSGKDPILDIDIRGALSIKKGYPHNAVSVFFVPPSFTELERRLKERGSISAADLKARVESAKREYAMLLSNEVRQVGVDYLIVNDDRAATLTLLTSLVAAERARLKRMAPSDIERVCQII